MAVTKYLLILLFIIGLGDLSIGQSREPITIEFEQTPLREALQAIDALPQVKLSYNPTALPSGTVINQSFVQVSIDEILQTLLGDQYELKHIGDYIIIQKTSKQKEKHTYKIKGDIKDAETGEKLTNVTIYEINTLDATLSDEKGEFELEVNAKTELATFAISRKNYQDTIVQLSDLQTLQSDLTLSPNTLSTPDDADTDRLAIEFNRLVRFFTSKKNRKNTENVTEIQDRYFQFSLIPAVGTNMSMGGQVRHKLSFNLLAGYSYGLDEGFELGGVYNINRHNVSGAQIAGFGNTVGGSASGFQMAGFINTSRDYGQIAQIAGFTNIVTDSLSGFQLSGFSNISGKLDGAQISGFSNVAKGRVDGFQLAGFSNHSRSVDGMQLSGVINTTNELEGVQLAGLINVTKILNGTQISVINYADSVASGIQLGLINIVKKNGYIEAGIEHNDLFPVGFTVRSGIHKFYNVFSVNTQFRDKRLWAGGFGFGSQLSLYKNLFATVEARAHYLGKWENPIETFNLLTRLHINLGYQLLNNLSITGGPVINIYIAEETGEGTGQYGYDIAQSPFYNEIEEGQSVQLWLGYEFAIRF
ncbi:carboxypeptidase-like regulatory domain-containing protein [Reichenbachiella agariperforans]|uniref:carboxypeptidase-like regulatory domain-containing protein n=1 Tax=Reichenbachiella agariperforans TaxID=156994 RepID=UPI001C0A5735|nr:carboxypeptidase-like regulatory domain-containing protein [Reichenbachiella agariperforans]MBU2913499.1 carboxypeptidase-like regulatory domain-containing protein [Reichenbachiella agariperforans]